MPRSRPTEKIDNLGGYDPSPLKDLWEYLECKDYEKKWFIKPPLFGVSGDSIENFYVDNKNDYAYAQSSLEKLRREQKLQNEISENRIKLIKEMYEKVQGDFVNLNNFIRSTSDKRKHSLRLISEEIEKQKEFKSQIEIKRKMVDDLIIFREEFRNTAEEYEPYEKVLNEAVKRSNNKFSCVEEMINHCDAIMFAQGHMTDMTDKLVDEIEQMKKRVIDIIRKAQLVALGLQNDINNMAHAYEMAQQKCLRWERIFVQVNQAVLSAELNKRRIRESIDHMYRLLCKRGHQSINLTEFVPNKMEKEIDFIKNEVELLREVIKEYNRRKSLKDSVNKPMSKC